MSDTADSRRWTPLQRQLHWWVAGVVGCQFALQVPMRGAMEAISRNEVISFGQFLVTTIHVWGGILILALSLYRMRLRQARPVPVGSAKISAVMATGVLLIHRLLLALVLVMGVSGLAHWYLGIEAAAKVHESAKWILGGLIALHVCGALWHRLSLQSGKPS